MLRNAGERILIKTATVAEKLPDQFKAQHPGVDWTGINRMRNLVAHHYDMVNDDLLWQTLTVRIPKLVRELGLQLPDTEATVEGTDQGTFDQWAGCDSVGRITRRCPKSRRARTNRDLKSVRRLMATADVRPARVRIPSGLPIRSRPDQGGCSICRRLS